MALYSIIHAPIFRYYTNNERRTARCGWVEVADLAHHPEHWGVVESDEQFWTWDTMSMRKCETCSLLALADLTEQ